MAVKIYEGLIGRNPGTGTSPGVLWADLGDAFEFKSVTGDDDDKVFHVTNKVSIEFINATGVYDTTQDIRNMQIKVKANDVEYTVSTRETQYLNFIRYRIIVGSKGDVIFRLASANNNNTISPSSDFSFAIVKVRDTIDTEQEASYGIYVPYSEGSYSSSTINPFNPTPRYLFTDDVTTDIANTGQSGSTATAALNYIINPDSKVTALVPIFANCSQWVSVNSFVMAIGNAYRDGEVTLNGKTYYCVGGFSMLEGDVDD